MKGTTARPGKIGRLQIARTATANELALIDGELLPLVEERERIEAEIGDQGEELVEGASLRLGILLDRIGTLQRVQQSLLSRKDTLGVSLSEAQKRQRELRALTLRPKERERFQDVLDAAGVLWEKMTALDAVYQELAQQGAMRATRMPPVMRAMMAPTDPRTGIPHPWRSTDRVDQLIAWAKQHGVDRELLTY